jgi:glucokinase
MLLVGDIGGTNTRLALYSNDSEQPLQLLAKNYPSRESDNLNEIVRQFLIHIAGERPDIQIKQAVFGIAGPIDRERGECVTTNLPWVVKISELQAVLKINDVFLLNDVESIAYGIPHMTGADLRQLNKNEDVKVGNPKGNMVLIAPGTGLGEAILLYDTLDMHHHISATEGGHADFAPRNQFEMGLLRYLHDKFWEDSFGHISYERVISGQGIGHIYDYLRENYSIPENPDVAHQLSKAKPEDRASIISRAAQKHISELCMTTLTTFVSILGAEAGNMALKMLAYGGVYLGGGIPPKIIDKLQDGSFMAAFVNKGRFAGTMLKIPVYVIVKDEPGLFGAACYAQFHSKL